MKMYFFYLIFRFWKIDKLKYYVSMNLNVCITIKMLYNDKYPKI